MLRSYVAAAVVFSASSLFACDDLDTAGLPRAPAPDKRPNLLAEAENGRRFHGSPIRIAVLHGANPEVQITIQASAEDGTIWSAMIGESTESLLNGEVNATLSRTQLKPRVANVALLQRGTRGARAVDGTLEATLSSGRVLTGAVRAEPNDLSVSLLGRYVVSCWVHPGELGSLDVGHGDGTVVARVEDVDFHTNFCRRFAHLR